MRILIATDNYYPPNVNGSAYFTSRLAHALVLAGHEVAVIVPSQTTSNSETMDIDVRVYGVRSFPIMFYPKFRFVLPFPIAIKHRTQEVLQKFKPEIVHAQMHFSISRSMIEQARRHNIPVIATNHFMPENVTHYLHLPKGITRAINALMWRDAAHVLNKAYVVSAPTKIASALLQPWIRTPVPVISNGIHLARFNPYNDPSRAQNTYKLPSKPLFLFVGRLDKEKNIDVVLRAAARAQTKADFHLVIAGKGAEQKKLQILAHELDIESIVTFTGFVSDDLLPSLYAACDCFVNACTAELQCIALMEAMATGCPAIGANAVALPELIHNSENGFLFEPGSVEELSGHMVHIANDKALREHMGTKSLEIIATHNIDKTVEMFERYYKEAIVSSKRSA